MYVTNEKSLKNADFGIGKKSMCGRVQWLSNLNFLKIDCFEGTDSLAWLLNRILGKFAFTKHRR